MMFIGSKYCPHCGAAPAEATPAQLSVLKCPRCKIDMASVTIGAAPMRECEGCGGLWVEVAVFEKICVHREQQSAVLGGASVTPTHQLSLSPNPDKICYVPCPQCGQLMNRINFARCSNVIVDVCKGHGTWFDRDELREIVEFIRRGGLEVSRQKEMHEIESQREQLHRDQIVAASLADAHGFSYPDEERISGLSAARGLLKFLIDK
jgi:Zn-finger nucleic acid-binding protein